MKFNIKVNRSLETSFLKMFALQITLFSKIDESCPTKLMEIDFDNHEKFFNKIIQLSNKFEGTKNFLGKKKILELLSCVTVRLMN